MNWNVIFTTFGVGIALFILAPFFIVLVLGYQKAKNSIDVQTFLSLEKARQENPDLDQAWEMFNEEIGE